MAKQIVVEIDQTTGDIEVDMVGFNGVGCKAVATAFEKMGKVKSETIKPEYYQGDGNTMVTTSR